MYIKQITISGFKSYRDAAAAGPFSPHHSVVVGRNGSGKSNFFDAVRFVLSDTYASLRAEERVALLHEGAGASVLSAYVEILFDNSDGRLPFDKEEVALRRMVGLKKDEYVLDRKHVTRAEVFNLLESAGFSRSNPYYIVQQGKVSALCAMTDKQRLGLLKEVAGTRVYDERREEVLRIMDEDDKKRRKVKEAVETLEARLAELESEKDELKAFQKLDKERRALEYTIYMKELHEAKDTLARVDEDRVQKASRSDALHAQLASTESELSAAEEAVQKFNSSLSQLSQERKRLDTARKDAVKTVAKLRVEVDEVETTIAASGEAISTAKAELTSIERDTEKKKRELAPMSQKFKAAKSLENSLRQNIAEAEAQILALRVKSDRGNHFTSVAQRDAYLSSEIANATELLKTTRTQHRDAVADVERLKNAINSSRASIDQYSGELALLREQQAAQEHELTQLKAERDSAYNARHDIWREDAKLKEALNALSADLKKLEAQKRAAFGSRTYSTIESVLAYSRERGSADVRPENVYGSVADLIQVDPKFVLAAEVTGANALSHVVVSSDAVSASLISYLQRTQGGRLTFIPLQQIAKNARPPRFERGTGDDDAIPLISKIKCDDRFRPAMNAIFGDTLVTRSISIAARLSKSYNSNCVTLDGDQVNKRGAMTGGYIAPVTSRLTSSRALAEARAKIDGYRPRQAELASRMETLSGRISEILSKIEVVSNKHRSTVIKVKSNEKTIGRLRHELTSDKELLRSADTRVKDLLSSIEATQERIASLEAEMGTELHSGLSHEDKAQLAALVENCTRYNEELRVAESSRTELEALVKELEAELSGNLERRARELKEVIADESEREITEKTLESLRSQLEEALTSEKNAIAELKSTDEGIARHRAEHKEVSEKYKSLKDTVALLKGKISSEMAELTTLRDTRSAALEKKAAAERHIRELGSVPGGIEKYRGKRDSTGLRKRLNAVNRELKGFERVNKKALEQYIHFKEQRQILEKKRTELEKAAEAIRALIGHLGMRKDEDIHRTFKGVSKCFTEVFSELVPGGIARLVMVKSNTENGPSEPGRIQYSGVAMKVKFGGRGGEEYMIQQLSGGQKSVVAMALIFAIQRLDPAPFYLFDEVDANLDAAYRHAVATLIRKQADKGTQFITTTFRSELVNAGDKWFGVTHKNKVSAIEEVDKESALTFITDEPSR